MRRHEVPAKSKAHRDDRPVNTFVQTCQVMNIQMS